MEYILPQKKKRLKTDMNLANVATHKKRTPGLNPGVFSFMRFFVQVFFKLAYGFSHWAVASLFTQAL